jgi:RNA polymerase sigma-70 factor (ECF subfamily)
MKLPMEQREVVLLIALEDMSYADVSRSLGIPIGTVMSRLSRGRERLRGYMAGEVTRTGPLRVIQ